MMRTLNAPAPLTADHRVADFDCGEASLNDWLKRRALANQSSGTSRTFVAADTDGRVWGYYALAAGAVSHELAVGAVRRNMPDPLPVLVLGRLAVDRQAQGLKLGAGLLQDAVKRACTVARHAGMRALLVHALDARAAAFYAYYGFLASPVQPGVLMLRLEASQASGV